MSEREPMTAGEAEALFDSAVAALHAVYGAPMAASILDGRARLITKEVNDHPICATEERCAFEAWAHADHRRLEPEEYEERTPDNTHYYADDSTNQAYCGWRAALAKAESEPVK